MATRRQPTGALADLDSGRIVTMRARRAREYRRADPRVREDICDVLTARADLEVSNVSVQVNNGIVTLEGAVPYRGMKHAIEDAAASCAGVHDVQNRLRVG